MPRSSPIPCELPQDEHDQRRSDVQHVELQPAPLQAAPSPRRGLDGQEERCVEVLASAVRCCGREGGVPGEETRRERGPQTRPQERPEDTRERLAACTGGAPPPPRRPTRAATPSSRP